MPTARHRTAMRRDQLSRPLRLALVHEIVQPGRTIFDYGCGRGDDISALAAQGYTTGGWDPAHRPDAERRAADIVNLGYVVNVIESPLERAEALRQAWALARAVLVVSARLTYERDDAHVAAFCDGWVTRHGTFQKFFEHEELGAWIKSVLEVEPVPAAPGTYYVFRQEADRQAHLSSRFRRPITIPRSRPSDERFQQHREALEPLIDFVAQRGRLPHQSELTTTNELVSAFGSVRQAFRVVLWVTDQESWDQVRRERTTDLLVHLALDRFHGRPRFTQLPEPLRRDIRAFFPSYKEACTKADQLLFSAGKPQAVDLVARAALVGKLTGNAIYVHHSALSDLPALLRVYEGCARALVGTIEDTTLIKLARDEPRVSYLAYPDFDRDPHPVLARAVVVDLREQKMQVFRYEGRQNPPILHRKEQFVAARYPNREKFLRLTAQEERVGLYTSPQTIGTQQGWREALTLAGVELRGHRVVRRTAQ